MTDELFNEKFKVTSEEIKKALNWEIDYPCPNCGYKRLEDAFKAIEITAGLSDCIPPPKQVATQNTNKWR